MSQIGTSILGYKGLLRREHGEITGRELDAVERYSHHLLALIDDLLDQATFENDRISIRPVVCNLWALLRRIEDMFWPLTEQKGLRLVACVGELPALLTLDEIRLRQVLVNLPDTAVKFTQQGEIILEASWNDGRLAIAIIDTGPGIDPEAQETIFQPFRQATVSSRQPQKGAGLGLAISRELVQRVGGTLRLHSRPNQGSRFELEIDAPLAGRPKPARTPPCEAEATRKQACILVAEHDEDIRFLLEVYLGNAGHNVDFAVDGAQAIELTIDLSPDLVLLDMGLPVRDGPSVAGALRARYYYRPIIALSATSTEHPRRVQWRPAATNSFPNPRTLSC